jgi:homoserine dehydrogenase
VPESLNKTKVAIVGLGTVGSGVARLLLDHGDRTARHAGRTLWLEQVVVRDLKKQRDADLPAGILSDDLSRITNDPEIKVVAQLIGGLEPARSIMIQLLKSGKDVVTANKALLAEHGPELFDLARELGRSIAFEASVAGGIPIITNLSQCFTANQITSLRGILNGTSNYIISRLEESSESYDDVLKQAQQKGYAEADPTMDVDGTDAAQKLAILAHLCFGARIHWSDIPREGIDTLKRADIDFAKDLGYRIRLIAAAQLFENGLDLNVSPTLVRAGTPMAEVRGPFNAISVVGDAVGRVFFHGPGAGQMPTASAVVADMIDTAVGRTQITFQNLELWSEQEARVPILDPDKSLNRFYTRFMIEDRPGVLAEIAGALGRNQISIASVIQHEPDPNDPEQIVPLVVMTHQASEKAMRMAMQEINQFTTVRGEGVRLRVLD